jgi:hypothetical protein
VLLLAILSISFFGAGLNDIVTITLLRGPSYVQVRPIWKAVRETDSSGGARTDQPGVLENGVGLIFVKLLPGACWRLFKVSLKENT